MRSIPSFRLMLVAGLACLAAACQAVGHSTALVVAGPPDRSGQVYEARMGEIFASQTHYPEQLVVIHEDFDIRQATSVNVREVRIRAQAGDQFYLTRGNYLGGNLAYCQIMDETRFEDTGEPDRLCLRDLNADGSFNDVWIMNEASPYGVIDGGPAVQAAEQLDPPIPYSVIEPTEASSIEIGFFMPLQIRTAHQWRIIPAATGIGTYNMRFDGHFRIPVYGPFPHQVAYMGTRIEILSTNPGEQSFTYRILDQAPEGAPSTIYRYAGANYINF